MIRPRGIFRSSVCDYVLLINLCVLLSIGVPWSEEEHRLFLLGLQKVGKGDWRGISRNFVKTRTPTQVASHAQKYFLRRSNANRRRRRSSLFDLTTETVSQKFFFFCEATEIKMTAASKYMYSA